MPTEMQNNNMRILLEEIRPHYEAAISLAVGFQDAGYPTCILKDDKAFKIVRNTTGGIDYVEVPRSWGWASITHVAYTHAEDMVKNPPGKYRIQDAFTLNSLGKQVKSYAEKAVAAS